MKEWQMKKLFVPSLTKVTIGVCIYFVFLVFLKSPETDQMGEESLDKGKLIQWVKKNEVLLKEEYKARNEYAKQVCNHYQTTVKQKRNRPISGGGVASIPYSDWLTLKRINWQTLFVAKKEGFVYCKVPKSGSSNWVYYMLKLAGLPEDDIHTDIGIHKLLRDYYPKVRNGKLPKGKFTFMVARHPFERILSAYRDKLENYTRDLQYRNGFYYTLYGKNIVKLFRDKSDPTLAERIEPTWTEFVRYLISTPHTKFDEHWKPIFSLCSPCSVTYNVIAKMETFSEDTQYIINKLHLEDQLYVEWIHRTSSETTSSIVSSYYNQLGPGQVDKLYKKYKLDFELFGYDHTVYRNMTTSGPET